MRGGAGAGPGKAGPRDYGHCSCRGLGLRPRASSSLTATGAPAGWSVTPERTHTGARGTPAVTGLKVAVPCGGRSGLRGVHPRRLWGSRGPEPGFCLTQASGDVGMGRRRRSQRPLWARGGVTWPCRGAAADAGAALGWGWWEPGGAAPLQTAGRAAWQSRHLICPGWGWVCRLASFMAARGSLLTVCVFPTGACAGPAFLNSVIFSHLWRVSFEGIVCIVTRPSNAPSRIFWIRVVGDSERWSLIDGFAFAEHLEGF